MKKQETPKGKTVIYDATYRGRPPAENEEVSPTITRHFGTGGGNVPFLIFHDEGGCRMSIEENNVAPTITCNYAKTHQDIISCEIT